MLATKGRREFGDLARFAQISPTLKILVVDQGDVVLVFRKEGECEVDQLAHGRDRLEVVEIELLLGRADLGVDVFEHRK